jgi:uncharacterized protein YdhG (YjbR/CyaY superfamily)
LATLIFVVDDLQTLYGMPSREGPKSVDDNLANYSKDIQELLQKLRKVVRESASQAEETISYQIPTFKLNGRNLVHFGAFKDHIAFFPTSFGREKFKKELSHYKGEGEPFNFRWTNRSPMV